mmetsp:Transcript_8515/g.34370  ORF Transcript_8515/g.34370 Transcript_8515/m.34370 type:complete len:211 (+) Transcript_8515:123-755(+)
MMTRSASPVLARLFIFRCALSASFCARIFSDSSLRPAPLLLDVLLATDTLRLLLECTLGCSSPSASIASTSSSPPLPASERERLRPSRTALADRALATASVVSMPIAPRLSFIRVVVSRLSGSLVRSRRIVGTLFATLFFRLCSDTSFARLARTCPSSSFSSSSRSGSISISAAALSSWNFASSSSSSRSSSASLSSISGSMKSATFLPL